MLAILCSFLIGVFWAVSAAAQPEFRISRDASLEPGPVHGRLVVYLVREDSEVEGDPSDGPFFSDPQPMAGLTVLRWDADRLAVVGADADWFGLDALRPGRYRAQAVLDRHRLSSSWRDEPGNLYSRVRLFELTAIDEPTLVPLHLDRRITAQPMPAAPRVRFHAFHSNLLTDARGQPVAVDAGVIEPIGFEPARDRRYPVIYQVPGFGGTHRGAADLADRLAEADPSSHLGRLARAAFWVVLNPEGPNGHHLFADSSCNGPVGRSLVEEIIPQIDALYPTVARPDARLLRGHSSGGWSVIHLAITYPEVFGGAWASAPDPLDFRAFQAVNIYDDTSLYLDASGEPIASFTTRDGEVQMTIRQENQMERVLGPGNTSGQQWDSWQAVFGGCDDAGRPRALFDDRTGQIDRGVAASYRRADLAERIRRDPAGAGRLARTRVRVIVGEADEFDLDRAVRLFVETLDEYAFDDEHGWAAFVPGATHGSILESGAARRLEQDMLDHLRRFGFDG